MYSMLIKKYRDVAYAFFLNITTQSTVKIVLNHMQWRESVHVAATREHFISS